MRRRDAPSCCLIQLRPNQVDHVQHPRAILICVLVVIVIESKDRLDGVEGRLVQKENGPVRGLSLRSIGQHEVRNESRRYVSDASQDKGVAYPSSVPRGWGNW